MKKKLTIDGSLIFLFVILGISLYVCLTCLFSFSRLSYKVGTFPLWTSSVCIVLCIAELIGTINRKRKEARSPGSTPKRKAKAPAIQLFYGILWLFALPVSIILFGFYIAMPLYAVVFLRFTKIKWIPCICIAIALFLIVYFGFGELMGMRLFPGIVFGGVFRI